MKSKIISETSMNLAEVKEALLEVRARDKELNFRAQKTLEYLEQTVKITGQEAKALAGKIEKLGISRLKEPHIQKLVGLLPTTADEIKIILQSYNITLTKEQLQGLVDVFSEYAVKSE